MVQLKYEFEVTGIERINNMFQTVERRLARISAAHRKMRAEMNAPGGAGGLPSNRNSPAVRRINEMRGEAIRAAQAEHQQRMRNLAQEAAARRRMSLADIAVARTIGKQRMDFARRTVGTAKRWYGGAASMAMHGAIGIGSYMAYDGMNKHMSMEKQALGIAKQDAAKGASRRQIYGRAQGLLGYAKTLGAQKMIHGSEVLKSMEAVQAMTGNAKMAKSAAPFLIDFAQGTDASTADTATMYSRLFMSLQKQNAGIADEGMRAGTSEKQAKELMLAFGGQGKFGSVEVKDFAKFVPRLTQMMASMKTDDYSSDLQTLGAFTQLVASDISGIEREMTAFQSFNENMKDKALGEDGGPLSINVGGKRKNGKYVGGKNIEVIGKDGARNPVDVALDMLEASGGDPTKLRLGNARAQRIFDPIVGMFNRLQKKGMGTDEIRAELGRIKSARMSPEQLQEQAGAHRMGTGVRMENFKNQLQDKVVDALFKSFTQEKEDGSREFNPELMSAIDQLASSLPKLIEVLGKLAEFVAKNPKTAMAALAAAPIAHTAATTAIGSMIGSGTSGVLGGLLGGGGAGAAAGGGGGVLGAMGIGIGGGLAALLGADALEKSITGNDKASVARIQGANSGLGTFFSGGGLDQTIMNMGLLDPMVQKPEANESKILGGDLRAADPGANKLMQASAVQEAAGAKLAQAAGELSAAARKLSSSDPTK